MNQQQAKALQAIARAIIEAVDAAGTTGAPGGTLYAALMTNGCTLEQFQQIMRGLVQAGMLTVTLAGNVYNVTDKGRAFAGFTAYRTQVAA